MWVYVWDLLVSFFLYCVYTEYKKLKETSPQIMSQLGLGGMSYESVESGMCVHVKISDL